MSEALWTEVDRYLTDTMVAEDPALIAAAVSSAAAGLPAIAVSPPQGKLLWMLARAVQARRVLEIGTLGGYSTIWLARALAPGGRVVTLESEPKHAEVARANVGRAGIAERVEVRLGRALDTLPKLAAEGGDPFDFTFIDADKPNIPDYFRHAIALSRPGSLILVDNVVREGKVIEAGSDDAAVQGVRRFNDLLARERRASATTIQTVGSKGYDGWTLAIVEGERR